MTRSDTSAEAALPLSPASFQILLVLASGPAHGYAIMLEVTRLTDGGAHLGPGTLYRTIQKLIDEDMIEAHGADADERRVPYRLTRHGAAVARAEARRLAHLVGIAHQRGLLGSTTRRRGVSP
jgi:DNA-binding PadR family transcriptional regulator